MPVLAQMELELGCAAWDPPPRRSFSVRCSFMDWKTKLASHVGAEGCSW